MKKSLRAHLLGNWKIGLTFEVNKVSRAEVRMPKVDVDSLRKANRKIFCIGFPKTGTTSLKFALSELGLQFGNQAVAEMLAEDWSTKRVDRIVNYCHTADAYQDLPFSMPGLFEVLDKAFPGSRFILSVRDSADQWFDSLVRFHTAKFSINSNAPTEEMLANALYRYKGFVLDTRKLFWGYPKIGLYDSDFYKGMYVEHNRSASEYFKSRREDFLMLNVATENSLQTLGRFFDLEVPGSAKFPWLNKTP